MTEEIELPMRTDKIQEFLPHRYPFLLVDIVTEFVKGDYILAHKNVTVNEQFFQGHFPVRPVMPGVLILEALAQVGAIFARLHEDRFDKESFILFAGADKLKFRRQVGPGDVLQLRMENYRRKLNYWKMDGSAYVDGKKVAEAVLRAAQVDQDALR